MNSLPATDQRPDVDDNARFADVIARARSVGECLTSAAPEIDAERELPSHVVAALHDAGMFRLLLPRSLGGDELDLRVHAEVMEIIASFDASTAWCMGQGAGCAMAAAFLDPVTARRLFGPRDAVLAWGAGIQGKATIVDGGYRVTGRWAFASGSRHATLLGGHSYIYDADGKPVTEADGRHRDRTMLFIRDKATIHDLWDVMGLRGTGSDTYEVTDLFVPEDETLDRENADECREPGPLYRCSTSLAYGVGFAALQLGIARAMLDELRDLAMKKTPRGATSSLRENPVFQTQLARLEASYRATRAYLHTASATTDQTVRAGHLTLDDRVDLKLATTHVINESVEIVHEVYRAAGATAIFRSNPFERRFRDALTASQQVQARITNYTTAGRCLLDLEPDTTMFL
jgi:alkylation response protein AidB-like acyl-CoA dehydrogenase